MRVTGSLRILSLLLFSILVLCIVSSAAFKVNPRSASRSIANDDDSTEENEGEDSAEVQVSIDLQRKKGNLRDYVFAKVNNPKLVRPRGKNSRTQEQQQTSSDEAEENDVHDGGDESAEEDPDDEEQPVMRRATPNNKKSAKREQRSRKSDRELTDDKNSAENVDEAEDNNRKAKKQKQPRGRSRDEDDDEEDQVVVEKPKKKGKSKHDDPESLNETVEKKSKKKSKLRNDDDEEDEEDDDPKPRKDKSKKKKSSKVKDEIEEDSEDDDNNSHWWNFFGYFNRDKDEEGFLEVIQKKRDEENVRIKQQNEMVDKKDKDAEEKESGKSWMSYLNRKPFSYLFDFAGMEEEEQSEDERTDTEPEKGTPLDMKREKKRSGPLSTDDFEEILAYIPSFVPNYTSIENIDCRRQGQIFHRQLRGQKLWAFQMIDAGGKIGSGILHGNINQLGNFDLCTEISTKVKITEDTMVRVKGKYCLAHLDIQATDDNLKYLMHLINGKSLLRSTINDPSHFVPRFTTFNWGVCVPAACTVEDVQEFLEASLEDYNSTGIRLNIEIDEENCYVAQKFHWDTLVKENYEIVAILACVSSVLVIVLLATMNQCWTHWRGANIVIEILDGSTGAATVDGGAEEMISLNGSGGEPEPHGLLNALILQFSLKDTWSQLTSIKDGDIECVHGFRALSSLGLFGILKVLQLIRAPYSNRVDLTEILNSPWSLVLRSPMLFMDVSLILTGFLTSYSLLRRHEATGRFGMLSTVLGKLIRMLPMIALTTLFQAHIWQHLGSGPQWNEIVGTHAKLCVDKWWKNLLFLQTTDKIEDACDPISYQFTVQMALFLVAPVIVWAMHKRPQLGLAIFGAINALSVAMRFSQTQTNRLAPVFYHGIKMTQIYRTMDMDHGSIVHRATPFVNGLALGFVLMQFGKRVKIPRSSNMCLWLLSLSGLGWCMFSQTHVTQRDYVYNAAEMAQFAAWVPLIWSYSIMWIVFACFSGNGDFANRILSAKPLVFISRISFALHFVQYIVLSSVSAKTRAVGHFEVSHFVNTFELCVIVVVSVFLTLTFDLPMQNVRDLLKQWTWTSGQEEGQDVKGNSDSVEEDQVEVGTGQMKKKSTEAIFKSNGNLDSSNFDWERPEEGVRTADTDTGNYQNHRVEKEEHLETFGNEQEEDERRNVEPDEDEEEYSDEEEQHEGGNSVRTREEIDDIWGSDNE